MSYASHKVAFPGEQHFMAIIKHHIFGIAISMHASYL